MPNTYDKSAVVVHREIVIQMLKQENPSLKSIAKRIGTNERHVRAFARREGIKYAAYSRRGKNNPRWIGGRLTTKPGYVLIYCPEHPFHNHLGYVWEHRLVMEKVLGRFLIPTEVVHHKNRNHSDNRPENLEVFQSNAEHLRHELTGKIPKWTARTLALQKQWLARGREILRKQILQKSEPRDGENQQIVFHFLK